MKNQNLLELIREGESLTLEFKQCKNKLNKDIFDTVCSFLNRNGGNLILGVSDDGNLVGVDPEYVAQIKKDFVTATNNPQKISPSFYLPVEEFEVDGKIILNIFVPISSQVHRCNGRIYDRNEDGDFDITDNTNLVTNMYMRKQNTYTENRIYPYANISDLKLESVEKARKMAANERVDHPWKTMNDMELQ